MVSPGNMIVEEGNHPSFVAKTRVSITAITNSGTDMVRTLPILRTLSNFESGFIPQNTPAANDDGTATRNANSANSAEFGRRLPTISLMFAPDLGDTPKSPWTAFLTQVPYLSTGCLSKPILFRRLLRFSGVACWPRSKDAASPGRNSVAPNMAIETANKVTTMSASLITKNLKILYGLLELSRRECVLCLG